MDIMKEIFEAVGFENTEAKQLNMTTCGGLLVTLHNKGQRPTRYQVSYNPLKKPVPRWHHNYNPNKERTYCLDTVICKNKSHECLKIQYSTSKTDAQECIGTLKRLLAQDCNGTQAETLEKYSPMGLLFWEKSFDKA